MTYRAAGDASMKLLLDIVSVHTVNGRCFDEHGTLVVECEDRYGVGQAVALLQRVKQLSAP